MKPEEIDMEIAEKIFGFSIQHGDCGMFYKDGESWLHSHYFKPSTNISHAFKVVERLSSEGLELRLDYVDSNWLVWFYSRETGRPASAPDNDNHPKDPAMAICLAVLKILEA